MFNLRKIINGRINVPEMEFLPVTASETFKAGEALVLSSGKLTKASGTTKPTYIAAKDYVAPASGAELLPCFRVEKNMVFRVPVTFSSTPVALVLGTKVTLHTDGLGVTDVTTSGVATIVDTLSAGSTTGDEIEVIIE